MDEGTYTQVRGSSRPENFLPFSSSISAKYSPLFLGFDFRHSHTICLFVSEASHYFLLVSFFCMNVISFDMCRTFVSSLPRSTSREQGEY